MLFSFFICIVGQAQEHTPRAVYAELAGGSILAGISFDSRFNRQSHFGYRVGLAYTIREIGEFGSCVSDHIRGFNIPLEVNCLVGKLWKKSHLELGFGVNSGLYENTLEYTRNCGGGDSYKVEKSTKFGYFVFCNVGYRYQKSDGLLFRVGLSPKLDFGGINGLLNYVGIFSFVPYLGVGYSF